MNRKTFGPIYALSSNNKTKLWKADVIENELLITHGYIDGKQIVDTKIILPKNLGKSNETTSFDQACKEAQSKMKKKMDEGYQTKIVTSIEEVNVELPMLAQKYTERKKYLKFPCYAQPKLNGARCIAKSGHFMSRKGKDFTTLSHLEKDINLFLKETKSKPDGEIFNPDWGFQEIIRALKKQRDNSNQLEYWIYDIVDTESTFEERTEKINKFFSDNSEEINILGYRKVGNLIEVPTFVANNEEEIKKLHKDFTKAGFEGSILRNADSLYLLNHRSNDLLKFKDFLDNEFEIVGAHEGTGNDAGTVIFECITKEGNTFSVRPKGTRESRKEWLKNIDAIIGKELTVRYQEKSEDGIPIFPVGLEIRDYE